jgi:hypothetical protein
MRKYFGIAILMFMLMPFLATLLWVKGEQYAAKKHVKRSIMYNTPKDELIRFDFQLSDTVLLNWKHNKEFEWQGEMYDIIYREYHNDGVIYYAWHDARETALNNQMARLYRSIFFSTENNSNQDICLQLILKGWLCEQLENNNFAKTISEEKRVDYSYFDVLLIGYSCGIDDPPNNRFS